MHPSRSQVYKMDLLMIISEENNNILLKYYDEYLAKKASCSEPILREYNRMEALAEALDKCLEDTKWKAEIKDMKTFNVIRQSIHHDLNTYNDPNQGLSVLRTKSYM